MVKVPFSPPLPDGQPQCDLEDGEIAETALPLRRDSIHSKSNKVCFFYFHHGHCPRDPENSPRPERPCAHTHHFDSSQLPPKAPSIPRRMHKKPCGISTCPLRHGMKQIVPKSEEEKIALREATKHKDPGSTNPKKRKQVAALELPATKKICNVTSSDKALIFGPSPGSSKDTCFFWYHGHCARSKDPRNRCMYRHELTDPPTMVQPPPGYVHRNGGCGLPWCPGDFRVSDPQPKPKEHVPQAVKNEDECEQNEESGDEDGESREEWYLKGFDDIG